MVIFAKRQISRSTIFFSPWRKTQRSAGFLRFAKHGGLRKKIVWQLPAKSWAKAGREVAEGFQSVALFANWFCGPFWQVFSRAAGTGPGKSTVRQCLQCVLVRVLQSIVWGKWRLLSFPAMETSRHDGRRWSCWRVISWRTSGAGRWFWNRGSSLALVPQY